MYVVACLVHTFHEGEAFRKFASPPINNS